MPRLTARMSDFVPNQPWGQMWNLISIIFPLGTVLNATAIAAGGFLGLRLYSKMPKRAQFALFCLSGAMATAFAALMLGKAVSLAPILLCLLAGGLCGYGLRLDALAGRMESLLFGSSDKEGLINGLITASTVFCVGPMVIVGPLAEGISGDRSILLYKSVMEGLGSISLAAMYGPGVLFSAIPVYLIQATFTAFAADLQFAFPSTLVAQLTATGGGILLVNIISVLLKRAVKPVNMLPSLFFIALLGHWF